MVDDPRPIGETLDRWRRVVGLGRADALAGVLAQWEGVAGSLGARSTPLLIRGDRLIVATDDPAVAAALRWRGEELLGELRAAVPACEAARIEVRIGRS